MARLINSYPIFFPFGATSAPYSPFRPHRGNDYALNEADPVTIGDTQIGLTGHTGAADGPHVHVQAGFDEWAQTNVTNSAPYVGRIGTVMKTGYGSQWGNYVCVKVENVWVYYCHLSRIDVSVGKVMHEEDSMSMIDGGDNWFARLNKTKIHERGQELSRDEFNQWIGKDVIHYIEAIQDNPDADAWFNAGQVGRVALRDNWQQQISDRDAWIRDRDVTIADLTGKLTAAQTTLAQAQAVSDVVAEQPTQTITEAVEKIKEDGSAKPDKTALGVRLLASVMKMPIISNMLLRKNK